MNRKAIFFLGPFFLFAALVAVLVVSLNKDPQLLPSARLGKPFPEFNLTSLHNPEKILSKQSLIGEVTLVNIWATWCASCLVEHPMLTKLDKSGVVIHGLNYKDVRPAAITFLKNHGNPYNKIIFDEKGDLGLDLGVYGAPETYFLDRVGRVRYRHVGVITPDIWENRLKPVYQGLIQEKKE